jgi:hypothetical protein
MTRFRTACALLVIALFATTSFSAPALTDSLKAGKADIKSAGVMTFGPEAILFVGDSVGGNIFAFDTQDRTASQAAPVDIAGINQKIAAMLGTMPEEILINDLAVNPISKKMYLSISRGRGPAATPVIVRVDGKGAITQLTTDNIAHAKLVLPDAPASQGEGRQNPRNNAITDLAFVDGKLLIAGLSNEEFASTLRATAFPFTPNSKGAGIEIWHGSHGRFETQSPVRTFVPFKIGNEQNIIAAYTCTPLVKIPVSSLTPGAKVKGTTIAELGSGNQPLDMISYTKAGKSFILLNNSNRGVMKMGADNLGNFKPITAPVDIEGVPYETIKTLTGVTQLDKVDDNMAAILLTAGNAVQLKTIALPNFP